MADPKPKKDVSGIRSVNIPADVRDQLRTEAAARGISMSALARTIMEDYNSGKLVVPSTPGPQLVSTSLWIPPDLWSKFTRRIEQHDHSAQWVMRTWFDAHHGETKAS